VVHVRQSHFNHRIRWLTCDNRISAPFALGQALSLELSQEALE